MLKATTQKTIGFRMEKLNYPLEYHITGKMKELYTLAHVFLKNMVEQKKHTVRQYNWKNLICIISKTGYSIWYVVKL